MDVFTDPVSGKSYLYWSNGYIAGAEFEEDMYTLNNETPTVMPPEGGALQDYAYREAPYIFYWNGLYYFLWSVDDTESPNYHVAFGMSDSPIICSRNKVPIPSGSVYRLDVFQYRQYDLMDYSYKPAMGRNGTLWSEYGLNQKILLFLSGRF